MSAVAAAAVPTTTRRGPVPFRRLVQVECRKVVDTRGGRGLMLAFGLVTAVAVALVTVLSAPADLGWARLSLAGAVPLAVLLPVMGVLAATAEWSQRTALTTFVLEPRRVRVGVAKFTAALVVGVAAVAAALLLGALANAIGVLVRAGSGGWVLSGGQLAGALGIELIAVTQGVAFGLAIGRTAPAIVAVLLLPSAWTVVGALVPALEPVTPWLDLGSATTPLLTGTTHGQDWLRLTTAGAVWVGLPLVVGLLRLRRHEVR